MEVCALLRYFSVLLFILLLIFVFAALFHSWSVGKRAKTQEGSLWNSVNFCTIPVALGFCKMCCLTYASLVVFVSYHDIDRAVYTPVNLSSFFFFWNECATLRLRIYSFRWLLFVSFGTSNLRTGVQIWRPVLVELSVRGTKMVPPNDWNTLCCCSTPLVFLFNCGQWTLRSRFHQFLLAAQCRCVTCVRLHNCGANLHSWCMLFSTAVLPFCDYNFCVFFLLFLSDLSLK